MAETNQPDGSRRDRAHHDVQIRTFLIADVRGWTLFTQERGDEAAAKLAAKFADVVREVVDARGGDLLELRGDEAMCVFSSAREAIRSAVDLQVRFVEETLDQPELPLTVGIGLDAGEAVAVQGGYRGGALNLAARLCGQARAGEVLASREVTHLARRLDGIRYEDRGALTFKNIPDPVEVVRVAPEELDTVERLRPFTPTPPLPPKRSRRWIVAVAVAAVLALVAIAIPLLGSDAPGPITLGSNAVTRLDAADGSVESTTSLRQRPGATVTGFGSVWVAYPDGRAVERLDAGDGTRTDTIEVGSSPSGIAIGHGSVWVTNAGDGTVSRIDPETGIVTEGFRAGASPSGIAVGDGALWVADGVGASLLRIDPASGRSDVVELDGQPTSVAFTEDGVWVAVAPDEVVLVDPDDLSITLTQPTGARPTAIVRAFDSIWVANDLDGTITRLDPSTGNEQATIAVGDGPASIVGAGERLWIAIEHDDAVVAIDPGTNDVERQLPVGATAASVASTGESLWLAVGASAGEHRGGTLAISSSGTLFDAPSLDPAIAYDPETWRVLTATNDGLVAYERVGGPAGASLVPDLASALPDVSADGLTYRFPLREGIRYSTGDPVRPEDFRRAIERAVLLHPAGLYLYSAIEGTSACTAEPPTCDLSDGIEVDARSVTFHLERPDPELPAKLALTMSYPVPAATPFEDQGLDALPATGPYMVDEVTMDGLELVRNPEFEEWSGAAQPDGFVDAISWRFNEDPGQAYERLTTEELDLMIDAPSGDDLAALRSASPDQVVQSSSPTFELFVGFDVQKPPFDDVRVRQAVNYAIDRDRVVELLGGPATQRPTCQILPPTFPGYLPYCPYTQEPKAGVWSAPDMDRARELVHAAGVAGTPVRVAVNADGLPSGAVDTMTYVTEILNELGLRAELDIVRSIDAYFSSINPPQAGGTPAGAPRHPHVYLTGWVSDYLGAGNMIEPQFHCGDLGFANTGGYCDGALDTRIEDALVLYTTEPGAASRAWTSIDHDLVDEAVQAPLTNPVTTYVVSERTGNVQLNPQWGLLLSLLWVR